LQRVLLRLLLMLAAYTGSLYRFTPSIHTYIYGDVVRGSAYDYGLRVKLTRQPQFKLHNHHCTEDGAITGTHISISSSVMPAVMVSPGMAGPTPSGVPVSNRSPGSNVCTALTAAIKAGKSNTIRAGHPCCRGVASPLSLSHMCSAVWSATRETGTKSDTGSDVCHPLAAVQGLPSLLARSCATRSVMSRARQ